VPELFPNEDAFLPQVPNSGGDMKPLRWQPSVALLLVAWYLPFSAPAAHAQWHPWSPLGNQKFDVGTGVTVLMPKADQVNLAAVGKDGKVYTNVWEQKAGWQGWAALGDLKVPAKTPVEVLI
jgi:hypothetical protein